MSQAPQASPHVPLTARYRPQRFADVVGQETVTAILSRAALEDRIAPAYLFSGTRGVGKTTIARIFAKALNCRKAPAAEPCNECDQCRRITQGGSVDVVEIDGASNRGIDDARRLKESIGYAPMDSRYKVFIIDEAHMLTREAFNALLKTLEEPPPRVTFILATTELHKLLPTIVSRCQQFTFKRVTEQALFAHLADVLNKEGITFEPAAVRLIARRGAGSVRDSMSLLGQVLALGGDGLTEAGAREVLGLAGQELFSRCLKAIARQDCPGVAAIVRALLDQGVDIGFFLRELAALWRDLFMIRQAGEAALPALDVSTEEAAALGEIAQSLELSHIHACWQMTLEGQRRILASLEPSQGLELLLLNLAMLPRLVSLEQISRGAPTSPAAPAMPPPASTSGAPGTPGGFTPPTPRSAHAGGKSAAEPRQAVAPGPTAAPAPNFSEPELVDEPEEFITDAFAPGSPAQTAFMPEAPIASATGYAGPDDFAPAPEAPVEDEFPSAAPEAPPQAPHSPRTWEAFVARCAEEPNGSGLPRLVRQVRGACEEGTLRVSPRYSTQRNQLLLPRNMELLTHLAKQFFGEHTRIVIDEPQETPKTPAELRAEAEQHPAVVALRAELGAQLISCMQGNLAERL